jgi:hypothetical protein
MKLPPVKLGLLARALALTLAGCGHAGGLGIFLVDRLRANAGPGGDPRPTVPGLA